MLDQVIFGKDVGYETLLMIQGLIIISLLFLVVKIFFGRSQSNKEKLVILGLLVFIYWFLNVWVF